MGLRERALRAWREYKRRLEEESQRRRREFLEEAREKAEKVFGGEWEIDFEKGVVRCDGIELHPRRTNDFVCPIVFHMEKVCEKCGRIIRSYDIRNLTDLGGVLAGERWGTHFCPREMEEAERDEEREKMEELLRLLAELLGPFLRADP